MKLTAPQVAALQLYATPAAERPDRDPVRPNTYRVLRREGLVIPNAGGPVLTPAGRDALTRATLPAEELAIVEARAAQLDAMPTEDDEEPADGSAPGQDAAGVSDPHVQRGPLTHEHEAWQVRESARGGTYCAACGATVTEPTPAERIAVAIVDRRPALLVLRPEVDPAAVSAELEARPLTAEEREAFSAGVDLARDRLAVLGGYGLPAARAQAEARPVHYTREQVLVRLRETGGFDLVLRPDDTAYDLETGDTLLGGVTLRYAYGEFPGPWATVTVLGDEPGPEVDDPREQPAPLDWSSIAAEVTEARQ